MRVCSGRCVSSVTPPAFNQMSAWQAFARTWDRCRGTGGRSLRGQQSWDHSAQPGGPTAKPLTPLEPLRACQGNGTPAMALRCPTVPTLVRRGMKKGERGMGGAAAGPGAGVTSPFSSTGCGAVTSSILVHSSWYVINAFH